MVASRLPAVTRRKIWELRGDHMKSKFLFGDLSPGMNSISVLLGFISADVQPCMMRCLPVIHECLRKKRKEWVEAHLHSMIWPHMGEQKETKHGALWGTCGADFLPCHLIQLPLYVGSKPFLCCAMISKTHEDGQENFVVKADEYWRWSSMEFLSEGHECRFCGMCCFKARLVSILEIVLGEIKRQKIIVCEFEGFIKLYPLVVADVLGIQSRFF